MCNNLGNLCSVAVGRDSDPSPYSNRSDRACVHPGDLLDLRIVSSAGLRNVNPAAEFFGQKGGLRLPLPVLGESKVGYFLALPSIQCPVLNLFQRLHRSVQLLLLGL